MIRYPHLLIYIRIERFLCYRILCIFIRTYRPWLNCIMFRGFLNYGFIGSFSPLLIYRRISYNSWINWLFIHISANLFLQYRFLRRVKKSKFWISHRNVLFTRRCTLIALIVWYFVQYKCTKKTPWLVFLEFLKSAFRKNLIPYLNTRMQGIFNQIYFLQSLSPISNLISQFFLFVK